MNAAKAYNSGKQHHAKQLIPSTNFNNKFQEIITSNQIASALCCSTNDRAAVQGGVLHPTQVFHSTVSSPDINAKAKVTPVHMFKLKPMQDKGGSKDEDPVLPSPDGNPQFSSFSFKQSNNHETLNFSNSKEALQP